MDETRTLRSCPGCESAMQLFTARTVEIERCPFCGGIWFDRGELQKVTGRAWEPERLEGHTSRRCAYCRISLTCALIGSVPAEVCSACLGTYLDDGELEELARRRVQLERVGAPSVATDEISYRCVGCGDSLSIDTGITTARGMSCRNCYGRTDFAGPSPYVARRPRRPRRAELAADAVDTALSEGILVSAIRWFLS